MKFHVIFYQSFNNLFLIAHVYCSVYFMCQYCKDLTCYTCWTRDFFCSCLSLFQICMSIWADCVKRNVITTQLAKWHCRETKSHLSMTHETALIQSHLEFMKILTTINRDFPSMTQSHLQNSWRYKLLFIEISQAELLSRTFRVHENIDYYW